MRKFSAIALVCGALLAASVTRADAGGPGDKVDAFKHPALAVPSAKAEPRMTAQADDPAWSGPDAGVPLAFVGGDSEFPGAAAKFATRVEARWDARFLYVRFWCRASEKPWAPHGSKLNALHSDGDVAEVFLDATGDSRQLVEIQVSPENGIFDKLYLLTGEPRTDARGELLNEMLKRDDWEFVGWEIPGLRSAAATWREGGETVGWIVDLALPAKPFLRRLGLKAYQAGLTLHAHFVRNACPLDPKVARGRAWLSFSWASIPLGRPQRSPATMGALTLEK